MVKKGDPRRDIKKGTPRRYIRGHNLGRSPTCRYEHVKDKPHKKGLRCRICDRARHRARKYGIMFEQALEMPEYCEICGEHEDDVPFGCMTLDHCHITDRFRGWLCAHCNKGLGAFKDSIPNLKNAIHYLRRFNATRS